MSKTADLKAKLDKAKEQSKELFNELRNDRTNETLRKKYNANKQLTDRLNKKYNEARVRESVDLFHAHQEEAEKVYNYIKEFKGAIFKADSTYTKKFKTYVEAYEKPENFYFYVKRRTYRSELIPDDCTLVCKGQAHEISQEVNEDFRKITLNADEIIEARRSHAELVKKLEEAKKACLDNYHVGVGESKICIGSYNNGFEEI